MNIEVKKSIKPVLYKRAMQLLERRAKDLSKGKGKELIWFLEHNPTFTSGVSFKENEILDKNINLIKTNRGGKITWHGPGQLVCYFAIDLNRRKRNIRKFVIAIENSIIESLKNLNIKSFSDRKNIGIWVEKGGTKKIAAIGIKVKKWIAFHGFSINISNSLKEYKKIIPCGIKDKGVITLNQLGSYNKKKFIKSIENNLIKNLKY